MADRSIVLDANILIRAVLGKRVGQLIEQYVRGVDLFAPDTAFVEAEEHLPDLCTKRGLPLDIAMAVYESLSALVEELPEPMYSQAGSGGASTNRAPGSGRLADNRLCADAWLPNLDRGQRFFRRWRSNLND